MKLSIIIVNYNVQGFLEHCLYSVQKAIKHINAEIFVVDNNSVDGSVQMLKQKFPQVKPIENKVNYGFSYANNQAIRKSQGEYILLLNPDTVVEEDTFSKILSFMDAHPQAGALGVKMLDGKGNFLPESKRSLPTPQVAFYKIFGLSKLFPNSKKFGKYHLSYLDKDKTHEVEILAGAFMLIRKNVLDKIGLLDEIFFMYGEDIDISYRIIKAGYKNYYFADTRIIHYKGESTKKSSVNYVIVFYNAMVIFAKKHFSQQNARLFSFLINIAIYIRASISILFRIIKKLALPSLDFIFTYLGVFLLAFYWGNFIKEAVYPREFLWIVIPFYCFFWLFSTYMSGGYDKPHKINNLLKGVFFGTVFILVFYSLLSEEFRFSRAIILLGSLWTFIYLISRTYLIHLIKYKNLVLNSEQEKRVVIVGSLNEIERVENILKNSSAIAPKFIGKINPGNACGNGEYLGSIQQLKEIVSIHRVGEVVFCAKDMDAQLIINQMSILGESLADFKIAPPESLYIIGSNSIDTSGDYYTFDLNSISKASNQRYKRLLDISLSLFLLLIFPLSSLIIPSPFQYFKNIFFVFFGFKSWVGYSPLVSHSHLPKLKNAILNPSDILSNKNANSEAISQLNTIYAKDYKPYNDLYIIWKGYKKLGRS
jgi:GT2 family glycosyltransferase